MEVAVNLIEKVHKAILEDGETNARQAARLAWEYEHATEAEQAAIDRVFICLCGWTLRTLITGREDLPYNPYRVPRTPETSIPS
jgi:hypothetical protein